MKRIAGFFLIVSLLLTIQTSMVTNIYALGEDESTTRRIRTVRMTQSLEVEGVDVDREPVITVLEDGTQELEIGKGESCELEIPFDADVLVVDATGSSVEVQNTDSAIADAIFSGVTLSTGGNFLKETIYAYKEGETTITFLVDGAQVGEYHVVVVPSGNAKCPNSVGYTFTNKTPAYAVVDGEKRDGFASKKTERTDVGTLSQETVSVTLHTLPVGVHEIQIFDNNDQLLMEDSVIVASHDVAVVPGEDATCTEDGTIEHYDCSLCNKHFEDEEGISELSNSDLRIAATGHAWDNGVVIEEPGIGVPGTRLYTCTICGETNEEEIEALPEERGATPTPTPSPRNETQHVDSESGMSGTTQQSGTHKNPEKHIDSSAYKSRSATFVYTINQKIDTATRSIQIVDRLEDVLTFVSSEGDVSVTCNGADIDAQVVINGQELLVTINDAASYAGQDISVAFSARVKDGADLSAYLGEGGNIASIPNTAATVFNGSERYDSETVNVKISLGGSGAGSGGNTSYGTTTSRNSAATPTSMQTTSAKTGDEAPIAGLTFVFLIAGALMITTKKRMQDVH